PILWNQVGWVLLVWPVIFAVLLFLGPWLATPVVTVIFFKSSLRQGTWSYLGEHIVVGIRNDITWLGKVGMTVILAILLGRIGLALVGRVGLVGGEFLGAFLAGALSAVIVRGNLPYPSLDSAGSLPRKYWSGPLLLLGMGSVGMLWFLFADGPTGFVLRRLNTFGIPGVFSPGGRFALDLSKSEKSLALWNVEAGQVGRSLEGSGFDPSSFAFSSDGTRVLAQSSDGTACLWNVETGQRL